MDCVYPFGVDPSWYLSPDGLVFNNSIKMRMSVLVGIWHMSMAITVKGFNAVHNKEWLVLVFEVIGGLIILNGLFGWMDVLILAKWVYPMNAYSTLDTPCLSENGMDDCGPVLTLRNCPAVISAMIANFMKLGEQDVYWMGPQKGITQLLLVLVFIAVPAMLCVKPCVLGCCCKKEHGPHNEFERIDAGPGDSHNDQAQAIDAAPKDEAAEDMKAYEKLLN